MEENVNDIRTRELISMLMNTNGTYNKKNIEYMIKILNRRQNKYDNFKIYKDNEKHKSLKKYRKI